MPSPFTTDIGSVRLLDCICTGLVARVRDSVHTEFRLESMKGRENLRDRGVDGRLILKWAVKTL